MKSNTLVSIDDLIESIDELKTDIIYEYEIKKEKEAYSIIKTLYDETILFEIYKKHMNFEFTYEKYIYCSRKCNFTPSAQSEKYSTTQLQKIGDIGWISGIIVFREDIQFMQDIIITIGQISVCKIDISLLIKLYGRAINDQLFFIEIPRKFIINKSIDSNLINSLPIEIEHIFGIPLFHLYYHEVRINVITTKKVCFRLVFDYALFSYLRIRRGIDLTYDDFDETLAIENIEKEYLSLNLTSYEKFVCRTNDFNKIISEGSHCDIIKICMKCFDSLVLMNKKTQKVEYNKMLYQMARQGKISKLYILPDVIANLIIKYDAFDPNHVVVIYEHLESNDTVYYKIYHKELSFNNGMLQ